jgi:hypothetical protein
VITGLLGFKSVEDGSVSEEELRQIMSGAQKSGGIEQQEGQLTGVCVSFSRKT